MNEYQLAVYFWSTVIVTGVVASVGFGAIERIFESHRGGSERRSEPSLPSMPSCPSSP